MILGDEVVATLLQDAVFAAISASKKVREIYDSGDFGVNMKSDSTPLTKADKISDSEIREQLLHTYIPLMSEEGRMIHYEERANWLLYWLVDPIDGTKEFIKVNGEFTVNIALIEEGYPIIGVICLPSTETLYFAARSVGSYKIPNRALSEIKEYKDCSVEKLLPKALRLPLPYEAEHRYTVVSSRSHLAPEMTSYLEKVRELHPDMLPPIPQGSSKKFCLVAEGTADLYPRITPTSEWDTAAGQAICEFADCVVVTMEKQPKRLIYNKEEMVNPSFIVIKAPQNKHSENPNNYAPEEAKLLKRDEEA